MAFGGRSQLKMSEEAFDFVCTACARYDKTIEAVKYCVECCGYCCQACTDAHDKFPALNGHNLMDTSQAPQASGHQASLPEFPTERCSIHKGKVMDMYCEGHDAVGCYVCFAKDHKSCQDNHIHSIPDMIDTLYKLSDCKRTHGLLRDMMASIDTVSKSEDKQLRALDAAKNEAVEKVTTFQKALEAILRKVAKSSIQEVEDAYKELRNEILQNKQNVDDISMALHTTDDKLNKLDENRAQRFVCSKIAQEKIKEADRLKTIQSLQHNESKQILFTQNQSLMEYINSLQAIGKVQAYGLKPDIYTIKATRDISIADAKVPPTHCYGCCLTQDKQQLIVTDNSYLKLQRIDLHTMSVVDHCTLDSQPCGVCCVGKHEVAVACMRNCKIQFVSIGNKMIPTKQIKMSHDCYGIGFKDEKLYVTNNSSSLYVYDKAGVLLKTITHDIAGNKLFNGSRHIAFNASGNRMFVGAGNYGLVCLDGFGNYLSTIKDADLIHVDGVCVDDKGNLFAVGSKSQNVVQFSEDGNKAGIVVKKGDGLPLPYSACFHQGLNRMFITLGNSHMLKMYELQ